MADGSIPQVEMSSCGPNGGPLDGKGEFPAYIACNIFSVENDSRLLNRQWPQHNIYLPKITQDGRDGDEETGFVTNILDNYGIGFKYFDCRGIKKIKVKTRGYSHGFFHVKTKWDGEPLASIRIDSSNIWAEHSSDIDLPDGIHALYFIYKGTGYATMGSFTLE
jgi:hypothetical protein